AGYRAPWNSVIKMAQKRALVGAALVATSASSLFTQDVEDTADAPVPASVAARAALRDRPREHQDLVMAWAREQGSPASPDRWDAWQWCEALVHLGSLPAATPASQPEQQSEAGAGDAEASSETSADDPWYVRPPQGERDGAWLDEARQRAV